MKKIVIISFAIVSLVACTNKDEQLRQRATELCQYVPDHELLEQSKGFLTEDFYSVLDTMFNHLPDEEPLEHEWIYYFVTGNGGTIADYTVTAVEQTDSKHAVATVSVRQTWEDGEVEENCEPETHYLYMEKVGGQWLMSDFDEHKQDCIRHIANHRKEQAMRDVMGDYLINEIGSQYRQGDLCIPVQMIVAEEEQDNGQVLVWGDFWVFWYQMDGDTLKTISGGNHSGCMTLVRHEGALTVSAFDQTVDGAGNMASAQRIFGNHFDIFQSMHSNPEIMEVNRQMQLRNYLERHNIIAHYYQDYGWPVVKL